MADRLRYATCAEPGCPEVVKTTYCDDCRRTKDRTFKAAAPERRKVYESKRWRAIRRRILRRDPFCVCDRDCCPNGCQELSTVVDHVIDIVAGGAPFELANLRGMAKRCHDRKTARDVWHAG